ncbi:hypothetical protein D3C73_1183220 [compost metagenome]
MKPIIVINKPIPTVIAILIDCGTATSNICRTLVTVKMMNTIPERNTAPRAACQVIAPFELRTTVMKYAFNPMPGASAIGIFTNNPIIIVINPAPTAVAKNTALSDIPAPFCPKNNVFTNRM